MEKKNWRILILDDEPDALEASARKIAYYVQEDGIRTAKTVEEFFLTLENFTPDLVFIDMELSDTDGFAVADYITANLPDTRFVFLTGHTELGAKSYDYEPLDFLSKPLDLLRLGKTMERFERSQTRRSGSGRVAVESTEGFVLISPDEVTHITREGRRTVLYCGGICYTLTGTMDQAEMIFSDYGLFRCHQSYLVNLNHIHSILKSEYGRTYEAQLDNGVRIPVSRHRYEALKEALSRVGTQFL